MSVKRIAPGLYEDAAGELHFDCNEACSAMGLPPTQENLDRAEELLRLAWAEVGGDPASVEVHDDELPPWRGYG